MTIKPPSKYFNNYGHLPRQKMLEDLIIQAIRMNGMYIKYMPREQFVKDELFGDHNYSAYNYAFEIEVYMKNVDSFEGQGDVFGKFGLELKDQITLTVARRRWNETTKPKILDESGDLIEAENSPKWQPNSTITFDLEDGTYERLYDLPRAGDIIYFPMVNELFEITFVEHENLFYQHGTLLTYDLTCELFKYSNEEFATGDTAIDLLGDLFNVDQDDIVFLTEDDKYLVDETDSNIVIENDVVDERNETADNQFFEGEGQQIIDFSEKSPFIRKTKW